MSHDIEGAGQHSCSLDPKVKVKGQLVYFRVNASPQPFDVLTSNFEDALVS